MASKADRFYFENLIQATEYSCKAAEYLAQCLSDYKYEGLRGMLQIMHEYEHSGDIKKHEMTAALAKAFVTPVDREDLSMISQSIDEVSDAIEEVLQVFFMYNVKEMLPEAVTFAKKIVECCTLMTEMVAEFSNFKKPDKLLKMVVDLNRVEEECDILYVDYTQLLNSKFTDVLDIISWRKIFDRLEACADACEHVGDCIDLIVMKNS